MISQIVSAVRGNGLPALPARVREDIARSQDRSEQIISSVQIAIVVIFGALFLISPRPDTSVTAFHLAPWALAAYLLFSVVRFVASCRMRLPGWFLTLSVIADMALLMVLIWSFHRTYQPPPSFYLKVPTLLYIFIFIALRALRFDALYVILAGLSAIIGWSLLVLYAAAFESGGMTITRDYVEYMTGNTILLGAEFDKLITIAMVTAILAVAVVRARGALSLAASEGTAKRDLSRFFDSYVAQAITGSEHELNPGEGQQRDAAVVFFDIRGFSAMSERLDTSGLVNLLSDYQSRVVPVVQENGGVIDKFLGDGIMATFGAVVPSQTHARDALRAIEAALDTVDDWNEAREGSGDFPVRVNASAASGNLVFAAVGDERRLEYTVIGDTVNLAAKLEKHTKQENARGVVSAEIFDLAVAQGFEPRHVYQSRPARMAEGVGKPLDLVVIDPAS